jgi:hypothetical protein
VSAFVPAGLRASLPLGDIASPDSNAPSRFVAIPLSQPILSLASLQLRRSLDQDPN